MFQFLRTPKLLGRLKVSLEYKQAERLGARGTFLGFEHFRGVEGRAGAPGWD